MSTVSDIASKYNKKTSEVREALQMLGYSHRLTPVAKVESDFESKLVAHWQRQSSLPPPKETPSASSKKPLTRKIQGTQVTEKPRRKINRPLPAPKAAAAGMKAMPEAPLAPPPPQKIPSLSPPPSRKSAFAPPGVLDTEKLYQKQIAAQGEKREDKKDDEIEVAAEKPAAAAAVVAPPESAPAPGRSTKKSPARGKIKIDERVVAARKKRRALRSKRQERAPANQHTFQKPAGPIVREVQIASAISVQRLSDQMALKSGVIIRKLMDHGMMVTVNELLDKETAWIIAEELGHKPVFAKETDLENEMLEWAEEGEMHPRPPVVTIMGHVDHGKTSLLDYIRDTKVASGEAGGITQHIGAYQVDAPGGAITFIDTPGHELFTAMRARGVQVTDIVVLVVAADDGVRPQTEEAINHALAAKAPIVVAANKMDKPEANLEKIKTELGNCNIVPEDWGGDTMVVAVSAATGAGVGELLEAINTQAEILELKAPKESPARGSVIEGRVEKGRGVVVTLVIRRGALRKGDIFLCGTENGKVRAMWNSAGDRIERAEPSMPVEIQGLSGIPEVGADFIVLDDERKAREIADLRQDKSRLSKLAAKSFSAADPRAMLLDADKLKEFNVIVRADVSGSREALAAALGGIAGKNAKVKVVHSGIGAVTESDVHLAQASRALIVAFNVRPDARARQMADSRGIKIMNGNVIYDVVEKVRDAVLHSLAPKVDEKIIGQAKVLQVFAISKVGNIAGCLVTDGTARASAVARVLRDGAIVYEGRLASLKRFKDDSAEVATGNECGIGIQKFNDIKDGDVIELLEIIETPQEL